MEKVHVLKVLTSIGQFQLSADYTCITVVPGVITHSSPGIVEAHLHSSLCWYVSIHKPNFSVIAWTYGVQQAIQCIYIYIYSKPLLQPKYLNNRQIDR